MMKILWIINQQKEPLKRHVLSLKPLIVAKKYTLQSKISAEKSIELLIMKNANYICSKLIKYPCQPCQRKIAYKFKDQRDRAFLPHHNFCFRLLRLTLQKMDSNTQSVNGQKMAVFVNLTININNNREALLTQSSSIYS